MATISGSVRNLVLLTSILLIVGNATAAQLEIEDGDREIWLNNQNSDASDFSATLTCSGEDLKPDWINVTKDDSSIKKVKNSSEIQVDSSDLEPGKFQVKATCQGNQSGDGSDSLNPEPVDFSVYRFKVESIESPGEHSLYYRGDRMGADSSSGISTEPIELEWKVEGPEHDLRGSDLSFSVTMFGEKLDIGQHYEFLDNDWDNPDKVYLKPKIPSDAPAGYEHFEVDIEVEESSGQSFHELVKTENRFNRPPVYISPVEVVSARPDKKGNIVSSEITDIVLDLKVAPGYPKDELIDDDFTVSNSKKPFALKSSPEGANRYKLVWDKDDIFDSDDLEFKVKFGDRNYIGDSNSYPIFRFDVADKVAFRGNVRDDQKMPVFTEFRAGDEIFETVDGRYSERFNSGRYDFSLSFHPGGEDSGAVSGLDLRKVDLNKDQDGQVRFNYDNDPDVNIKGVNAKDMMSVVFGYPFKGSGSTAWMKFDPSGIDPTSVDVFECRKYNFFSQSCLSGWSRIPEGDVTMIPTVWKVKFPVEPLETEYYGSDREILMSAYAVGTNSGLQISDDGITLKGVEDNSRVAVGKSVTATGEIVSENGNPVEDANVTLKMMDGDDVVDTFEDGDGTDSDGVFRLSGKVPEDPANLTLKLEALKDPYNSLETEYGTELTVYQEQGLTMRREEGVTRVSLQAGEEKTSRLVLENTGDVDLEDIKLSVTDSEGVNPDYFELVDPEIESIGPGDTEDIRINFDIPGDCPGTGCNSFLSVEISAEASSEKGGVEKSLTLRPKLVSSTSSSSEEDDGEEKGSTESPGKDNKTTGEDGSGTELPGMKATSDFLRSTSSLNLALGLVFVFLTILAGAVRKKNESGGRDRKRMNNRGGGGRPPVRSPDLGSSEDDRGEDKDNEDLTEEELEEIRDQLEGEEPVEGEESDSVEEQETGEGRESMAEAMKEIGDEGNEDSGREGSFKCDTCGEEFDTEVAMEMHRQAVH